MSITENLKNIDGETTGMLVVDLSNKRRAYVNGDGSNIKTVVIIQKDGLQKQSVELPEAVSTFSISENGVELQEGRTKFSVNYPRDGVKEDIISVSQHSLAEAKIEEYPKIDSLSKIDKSPWYIERERILLFDINNLRNLNLSVKIEKVPSQVL